MVVRGDVDLLFFDWMMRGVPQIFFGSISYMAVKGPVLVHFNVAVFIISIQVGVMSGRRWYLGHINAM